MGLLEGLEKVKGLSESEKALMIDRSDELQAGGMAQLDAERQVLTEMRDEIDTDYIQLRKGLRMKTPSKGRVKANRDELRSKEEANIRQRYQDEEAAGEVKNDKGKKE